MKYVCVTLVGGHKLYSMPLFFEYIGKLQTLPQEIWVSCTKKIYDECMKAYNLDIPIKHLHGEGDLGDDYIHSTTAAREAIRQEIAQSDYDWALWLDNDMLVPPDMIEKFQLLLQKTPDLLMVNAYHPARQDGIRIRHGLGSSFISKEMMAAYPFMMATIRGKNLGDDYLWKIMMTQFKSIFKFSILSGIYFDVKHLTKDGRIKEFDSEARKQLL